MSTISSATSPLSQGTGSQSESGFKSFWRKTKQDLPSSTKKKNAKTSRNGDNNSAVQKRREQVYQAQKRHRNRKAEYLKTLEEEVARLQQLDALVNSQRNVLIYQNEAFRDYFATQSLAVPFDSPRFSSSPEVSSTPSRLGSASIDVRFDPEIGHERTFMDLSDSDDPGYYAATSGSSDFVLSPSSASQNGHTESSSNWIALDFILALEWPCQNHNAHGGINPTAINPHAQPSSPDEADPFELHGHALTMTAAVYQSAQPAYSETSTATPPADAQLGELEPSSWQIPHSEIDKLIRLSENLELDEEQTTPAQAYAHIKRLGLTEAQLQGALKSLKASLSTSVGCFGFGAAVPTSHFLEQLNVCLNHAT